MGYAFGNIPKGIDACGSAPTTEDARLNGQWQIEAVAMLLVSFRLPDPDPNFIQEVLRTFIPKTIGKAPSAVGAPLASIIRPTIMKLSVLPAPCFQFIAKMPGECVQYEFLRSSVVIT